jgi:hypothetical protein
LIICIKKNNNRVYFLNEACPSSWKPYNGPEGPQLDGLSVGQTAEGKEVYVSRAYYTTQFGTQYAPGSLLIEESGSRIAGHYTENDGAERYISSDIQYYVKLPECNCKWVNSSNDEIVQNAVQYQADDLFYVGRAFYEGSWYVGKIPLSTSTMFYGPGKYAFSYEVLVCEKLPTPTTTTASAPITDAPITEAPST